jgi:hypothetical protein
MDSAMTKIGYTMMLSRRVRSSWCETESVMIIGHAIPGEALGEPQ